MPLTRRTKVLIVVVFVGLTVVPVVVLKLFGVERTSPVATCEKKCQANGKFGKLVPVLAPQPAKPIEGPQECICY